MLLQGIVFARVIIETLKRRAATAAAHRLSRTVYHGSRVRQLRVCARPDPLSRFRNLYDYDLLKGRAGGVGFRQLTDSAAGHGDDGVFEELTDEDFDADEQWTPVYRYKHIAVAIITAKAKLYQTIVAVGSVPVSALLYHLVSVFSCSSPLSILTCPVCDSLFVM